MKKRANTVKITREFILESVSIDPATRCWNWKKSIMSNGYGALGENYKVTGAHRKAFELWRHPLPKGAFVLHHCDNRKCCNPEHLFIGDAKANTQDMMSKGRNGWGRLAGCSSPNAKLTKEQVIQIRNSPLSRKSLCLLLGVSRNTIAKILRGTSYVEVA